MAAVVDADGMDEISIPEPPPPPAPAPIPEPPPPPASAPLLKSRSVSKEIEDVVERVTVLDTTGDGHPDTLAADSSGDGKYDTFIRMEHGAESFDPRLSARGNGTQRTLFIRRVELTRLSHVDDNVGTFAAQVYVAFVFKNGANDAVLCAPSKQKLSTPVFPIDEMGVPTWQPNAAWYLNKLCFDNLHIQPSKQVEERVQSVHVEGNDLVLSIYTEGVFHERFELQHFPFDAQDLTIQLSLHVSVDSPAACWLRFESDAVGDLPRMGYLIAHRWLLQENSGKVILFGTNEIEEQQSGENGKMRTFATAYFSVKIQRRPGYFMFNILLPSFLFVPLGMLQFTILPTEPERVSCALGLVLVIVLFKFAVVSPSNFPAVNYMTLLDKQVLSCQLGARRAHLPAACACPCMHALAPVCIAGICASRAAPQSSSSWPLRMASSRRWGVASWRR